MTQETRKIKDRREQTLPVRASGGTAALYLATAYVAGMAHVLVGVDLPSLVDPLDNIERFARHLR